MPRSLLEALRRLAQLTGHRDPERILRRPQKSSGERVVRAWWVRD